MICPSGLPIAYKLVAYKTNYVYRSQTCRSLYYVPSMYQKIMPLENVNKRLCYVISIYILLRRISRQLRLLFSLCLTV